MGGILWWAGLVVVVVVVFPAVAYLALRIIRSLAVVQGAAESIQTSVADVGDGVPAAVQALESVARRCEALAMEVKA